MRRPHFSPRFKPALFVIPAALAFGAMTVPVPAAAQIGIGIGVGGVAVTATVAPPPLIEYEQPPIPAPGYLFTPGYWAYGDEGYYWVPGTWVEPPSVGLLWTPGYWGFNGGRYIFNAGYWGATVGFYGGIDYGFGYGGLGYEGGFWRGGAFQYNRAVNNFGGVHITNVYEKNVTHVTVNRASFNGPGGVNRQPTGPELAAAHENHIPPTPAQRQHFEAARNNPELRDSVNHGHPPITATSRPGDFKAAATHGAAPGPHAVAPGGRTEPGRTEPGRAPGEAGHAPGPHPVTGTHAAPGPHPVTHSATAPHSYTHTAPHTVTHSPMGAGEAHPMREPMSAPREGGEPHAMAPHAEAPHAMAPHAMAPHAEAPHPAAPHPAAPHPEEKPHH